MRFPGRSVILFGFLVVPATVSAEIIEEIVARVNDQVITKSELEERESLMIQDFFQKFAGVELDEMLSEGRENLLRDLIAEKLLLERGAALLDMGKVRESLLKDFMDRQGIKNRQELAELLKREDMTVEEFLSNLIRVAVPQEILNFEVRNKIKVEEDEAREYYRLHREEYSRPETVLFREIVLLASGENRSEIRANLEIFREAILQGADFLEISEANSDASSRSQGGLVGPFQRTDLLTEIADVAFSMDEGEISEIIDLPHGFHLIRLEEHKEVHTALFEEMQDEIRQILYEEKGEAGMRDYIIKLWKESYVYLYPGYHGRVPPLFLEMSKDSADAEKPIFP
ncbi:MAG: peptidylprolyl isomerase [Acidobacteriota bacterium]